MANLTIGNHILMDDSCDTTNTWYPDHLRGATKVQEEFDVNDGNFDAVAVFGNLRPGDLVMPQREAQSHYFVFDFYSKNKTERGESGVMPRRIKSLKRRQILWQRELPRNVYAANIFTQYWYVEWKLTLQSTDPAFFPQQTHIAVLSKEYETLPLMEPPSTDVEVKLEPNRNFANVDEILLARDLNRVIPDSYRRRLAARDTYGRYHRYHI